MNFKLVLSFLVFTLFITDISAQQPLPCGLPSPPGADDCNNACVYCDLTANGYVGSTIGYTPDPPNNFCGTIENNQWFAFAAGTTTVEFTINASNCANGDGVQGAIYPACGTNGPPIVCEGGSNNGANNAIVVTATNLVVGQIYWFMVDGWLGDECDYDVTVTQGNTDPPPLDPPGPITGPTSFCVGETATYSVPPLPGASYYEWVLPDGTVVTGPNPTVDYTFGVGGQVCVQANNVCNYSTQVCITVTAVQPDAGNINVAPSPLCPNELATITVGAYNMAPEFTELILVTDANGVIVNISAPPSSTFTHNACGVFDVCSYNFLTAEVTAPVVGQNISSIDCASNCCDIVCQPLNFEDHTDPVFPNAPGNVTYPCFDLVPPLTDQTWTDNCDGTGTVSGTESGSADLCNGGTLTRTWEYTDACGNIGTHVQTITVDPMPAATFINPPADITVSCDNIPSSGTDLAYENVAAPGACSISGTVSPTVSGTGDICGGTLTYTWEFTDVCNRTITHSQVVTITPPAAPAFINPPADATFDCNNIPSGAPDLDYSNNETGACLFAGTVSPSVSGSADICGGVITYTWDFTDPCGNTISHSQTITITQPAAPAFINPPADMTVTCDNIPTSAPDLTYTNNETGACLFEGSVPASVSGNADICGGTLTYTWIFSDPCGNNIGHSQTITVTPPAPPAFINPPADMTVSCDNIPTSAPDLSYTNNETGACLFEGTVPATQNGSVDFCGGAIVYTWTFSDQCGNAINHSQTITVTPPAPPAFINPPADMTVSCDNIPTSAPDLSYTNNETGACLFEGTVSPSQSGSADICGGALIYTWTFTDPCGNPINHSQTITITPPAPPVFINPPADMTVSCDNIPTSAPDLSYTNNETGACLFEGTIPATQNGSVDFCGGAIVYTWTFSDQCGNAINHSQTITVTPPAPPAFINPPADMTVSCDNIPTSAPDLSYTNNETGACLFEGTVAATVSGNATICGGALIYAWTFTDPCGNAINHSQTITVTPPAPPAFINPPADMTVSCDNIPTSAPDLSYTNNETGACLFEGTVAATVSGNATICGGALVYAWTFTDPCGNAINHSQTITVTPPIPPIFTSPPADMTVSCDNIPTSAPDLTYTNNETGACLFTGSVPAVASGSADICGGAITYTWDFTDPCGNAINHSQTITVTPAPPAAFINPPADMTVDCNNIPAMQDLDYDNGETGACGINGTVTGTETSSYDPCGGTVSREWTFTDQCNNTITHTQTITISPAPPPVFNNPPADITVSCGANIPPFSDLSYDNGLTGVCGISGSVPGVETGTYDACGGAVSRTWTYTDGCNNLTHTQNITITPAAPPVFTNPPADMTVSCDAIPPITTISYDNGLSGLCNISGMVQGVQSGGYNSCGGTLTRTWNLSDICGNTVDHVQTITILPAAPPAFINTPADETVNCTEFFPPDLAYDNGQPGVCNISGTITPTQSGTYNECGGTVVLTWDFTDDCGNNINHVQTVTISPAEQSQFLNPPASVTVSCSNIPPLGDLAYSNNSVDVCLIAGTVPGTESGDVDVCGGVITRVWEFTDLCGNTISHSQQITVSPPPPPNWNNPPTDITLTCGDPLPPLNNLFYSNNQSGFCSINGSAIGFESGSYDACGGALTRTWTAELPCGITLNHVQNITINPAPAPNFVNPPIDEQVDCGNIPPLQDLFYTNGLSGFCEIAGTAMGTESGTYDACGGALTRSWDITDACGNTINYTQVITIDPAPAPQYLNLPADMTLNCGETPPPLTDLYYDNGVFGACALNGNAPGQESGTLDACGGELTRTWDFTDPCGNFITHTQIITSLPAPPPVFELPPQGTLISCDEIYPMTSLSYDNGASGICNISGSVLGEDFVISDDCTDDITRIWTFTDQCGNTIEEFELIISTDFTPPVMDTPPPNEIIPCSGEVPPMTDLGWTDNCDGSGTVVGTDSSDGGNPEVITRTWEYIDACGNADAVSQTFTVNNFEILQAFAGVCDNQGTLSDPDDDTFDATVEATIGSPGPSNQYTVTDGTNTWGPFTYGSPAVITGLPADGSDITLTISDVDDPGCSETVTLSQLSCSTNCLLSVEPYTLGACNDNGTPSDPTDDFFDLMVDASITNGGSSNQFTVTDGTNTWGPFDYGTGGTISGLPANGNNITLTFSDIDIPGCANQIQISLNSCSSLCELSITNALIGACQNQGTASDPTDDTFEVTVNATAQNPGASNQFTVTDGTSTWGPFDYGVGGVITGLPADGSVITLTFIDADDPTCLATVDVSQSSCSELCVLTVDQTILGACNDNGTNADPSDDFFEVTVNASAANPGASNQYTVTDGTNTWGPFDYGVAATISPLPANGNTITLTFSDVDISACAQQMQVSSNPCSSSCVLSIDQLLSGICNDNGTPSDPSDDFFDVTVNASATNPGTSGQYTISDGTNTWGPFDYGSTETISGLPADGSLINFTFTDVDDISCNAVGQVTSNACSDLCVLTIDQSTIGACNDNGTNADPSDDFFEVTVIASGINPGPSNQYTVTDGSTTWGPFDYGSPGIITGLPANGNNITLIFTDVDITTCSQQIQVSSNPCSSSCILAIDQLISGACNDNGTPADPGDDFFEVTINASATNPGPSGQYTVSDGTNTWGPFDYGAGNFISGLPADGSNITLTFVDVDDISCNASDQVSSEACSDLCVLAIDESTVGPCDDNGTDTDPSDDTYEVTVNATAVNPGAANQFTVTDGSTTWGPFDYGVGGVIIDLPADGSIISLTFSDVDDNDCAATVDVTQLPCSSSCIFSIDQATAGPCNDNGTPADPSDDFFGVTINASATNPGAPGQYTVTDGAMTWGPFDYNSIQTINGLPANGTDITLTFADVDDIGCNATVVLNVDPCSPLCILTIDESSIGPCDDNGTDTDPSDDTYEVTVNATAVNPGAANQFTVTDGSTTWGPFDYGVGGVIIDLPADGSIISLTFSDVDDNACVATVDVTQLPCSSSCIFSIDQATAGPCNDNGTPADPSDDFFDVTINASATNPGASGQYTVTDGAMTWGPFDYNSIQTINGLPANGTDITLTFADVDDIGCNAAVVLNVESCSPLCILTIDESSIGSCDDNGTDTDPSDDTYEVTVNATAVNPGAANQFTVTDGTTTWGPFDYGVGGVIIDLPADGSVISLTFSDVDDNACAALVDVTQLPCSSSCIFSIDQATAGPCNDNGTPVDPSDDFFDVTINASATNPGTSGQYTVTDGAMTWGPFDYNSIQTINGLPANGADITLTFADVDDISCNAAVVLNVEPCSPLCILTIDESSIGPCDDNGTDTDPSDDTYQVTVNASAVNPGAANQFTVTDGTTTWGPFDYGVGGVIIDLPADGSIISLTFTDVDDNACAATVDVTQLPCSSSCIFSIDQATAGPCNDNGTPADPSDDFFDVTINASATNPGASGQYTVTDGAMTWGPFDYNSIQTINGLPADGTDITLTFADVDDIGCNAVVVLNVEPCSPLCILTIDESTVGPCDDNGTDTDPSDDTYQVTVNATAVNPGAANQFTVTDGTTTWGPFDYGVGGVIIDLPADGSIISLTFSDVDDNVCAAMVDVTQLPCSSACIFSIDQATAGSCNDNGTPADPSDDFFDVTINASATNPGASGQYTVSDGTNTWGPFDYNSIQTINGLPADGTDITLTFADVDDIGCNAAVVLNVEPCSPLCILTIDESSIGPCDDNGTDTDPSDDTYQVTVNATAVNPGAANQFTVTDGSTTWGPFDYGVGGVIIDLPADGSIISLTFEDVDDNACSATVDVTQLPCSSSCTFSIDQATAGPCNDNGTPVDPSDDFFDVTINASATNPGASGQYTVTDGAMTWGPFDYNSIQTINGLPANGTDITLTFADVDDIGCNAVVVLNVEPCSPLCILTIDESTVGPCDDNGTDTDPSDDTYQVTVNATAVNPGAANQFTVTDGSTTWGPFDYGVGGVIIDLPADGSIISLTFTDVDDNACAATVDVTQLPCSSPCTLTIDESSIGICDDQGTLADPTDDLFNVTVNATASNPGPTGQFTVTDGTNTWGPFDYGVGGIIPDLPANSTIIMLTFTDVDDLLCSTFTEVSQDPCSECNLEIDAGPEQALTCSTLSVQLLGVSNEAAFFEWSGPGINGSNQNQEQPIVDQPGLYTLTVSNLTTGCIETDEVLVDIIDDAPIAAASSPDIITCETTTIELNSNGSSVGSSIVYTWSGPDPNLEVNATNPETDIPGIYTLLVTDTTNNCTSLDSVIVEINTEPPVAILNLIGSLSCITTSTLLDGAGSSVGDSIQYQWYLEGQIIPGADQISTVINQPGEYTFVVLNIINGCNSADSLTVVDDMAYPVASAGEADLLTCVIDSVQLNGSGSTNATQITYEWTGPAGGILSGENTLMPWVTLPGIYIISVTDTLNGCENLDSVIVSQDIASPFSDAGSDVILDCNSLQAGLDGSNSSTGALYSFEWLENDGSILSGGSTLEPTVDAIGNYSLVITNIENGCTAIDNVLVTPPDVPSDLIISMINPTCFGDSDGSITIDSVIGGYQPYTFEFDNQVSTSNNTFGFLTAGNYSLTVTDSEGCGFETTMQLQDGNNVFLQLEEDMQIELGDSVTLNTYINLTPSEIDSLQWTPIDGTLNCYNCIDPVAMPMVTTTYTAEVWDHNGCTARDDITIFLLKDRKVYIPNAFSPNGDGVNDKFIIYANQGVKQINSLHIYSRWGEEVFENSNFQPNDPDHGWDGTLRGEPMNPAVFVYWAEIEFLDGFKKLYKGDITIVK